VLLEREASGKAEGFFKKINQGNRFGRHFKQIGRNPQDAVAVDAARAATIFLFNRFVNACCLANDKHMARSEKDIRACLQFAARLSDVKITSGTMP